MRLAAFFQRSFFHLMPVWLLTCSFCSLGTGWPAQYAPYLENVRNDPQQVLDDLTSFESAGNEHVAITSYIRSRAYGALALHEKARVAAQNGLTAISDDNSELFHYLRLARAEALDGLGMAQAVVDDARDSLEWARANNELALINYALSVNGYLHITLSQFTEAQILFQEGYQRPSIKPKAWHQADFASMLALVYEYREESDHALQLYEQAETYYRQQGIQLELANTLFGIGKNTVALGNSEEGLRYLLESADIALNIRDLQGAAFSYESIASVLIEKGMSDEAVPFLDDALSLFSQAGNPFMQIKVLVEQANVFIQNGQADKAMPLLSKANSLATGDSFLSQKIAIADTQAHAHAKLGNFEAAYNAQQNSKQTRRMWQEEVNDRRILELQTRFDVQQQKVQNALLQEQNLRQQNLLENEQEVRRYTVAMVLLLCLVSALLAWLYINSRRHQKHLQKLANSDGLTGLLTRRKGMEDAEQQFQLALRHKTPTTAVIIDLDHFKQINDTYGHQTGDDVLRTFGELANTHFRKTDILSRIGGEEFLFVFPHTATGTATTMLEKFADEVRTIPQRIAVKKLTVTLSMGLVECENYSDLQKVIAAADAALYEAKNQGRDRIIIAKAPQA